MKNVSGAMVRKLYINQVAMAVFGVMVISAAAFMGDELMVLASLLAIGVYLFLIYDAMWNAGAKDAARRLRAEDAELDKIRTPFYIVLFASLFNLGGALIYLMLRGAISAGGLTEGALVLAGDTVHIIMNYANSIYNGFAAMLFPHPHYGLTAQEVAELNAIYGRPTITELTEPWFYFLIPVPLFATGMLAYYVGASETTLRKILAEIFKSANG